jgi:hypothetical protein
MVKSTPTIDWGQGRIDRPRATIPVFTPSELATTEEKNRLFAGLEKFANLGDTFEDYQEFLVQWPTFLPASIKYIEENNPEARPLNWSTPECHRFVLVYRGVLKRLWIKDQEALGTGLGSFILGIDNALGTGLVPYIPGFDQAWSQLKACYWRLQIEPPNLFAHWGSGAFLFNPLTDFQKAAYILFRESWRARVCPLCSGFFIAQRAPQIYCSPTCYGMTKRRRGHEWWNQNGKEWRAQRKKTSQKGRKRTQLPKKGDK